MSCQIPHPETKKCENKHKNIYLLISLFFLHLSLGAVWGCFGGISGDMFLGVWVVFWRYFEGIVGGV